MRKILILSISILSIACNPLAKLPGIQSEADIAFEHNNFQKAYTLYQQYIKLSTDNNSQVNDDIYLKMAQTSGKLDKLDEAGKLYTQLIEKTENESLLLEYAQLLQKNSKTQLETDLWNSHDIKDMQLQIQKTERLIALYAASQNPDEVINTYANKGDIMVSKEATMAYVSALEQTNNKVEAAKVCNTLVKAYPNYIPALEWKGKYYYEKADTRYKAEMAQYNKNKNATSYAYLLRDLKKVSADFRIARDTFEQLRKQYPENKTYIKYLKNCYLRLEQKAEAAKMEKLLK